MQVDSAMCGLRDQGLKKPCAMGVYDFLVEMFMASFLKSFKAAKVYRLRFFADGLFVGLLPPPRNRVRFPNTSVTYVLFSRMASSNVRARDGHFRIVGCSGIISNT